MKREKQFGGLNLYNTTELKNALNVKMMYKIIHSEEQDWNAIGKFNLKVLDDIYQHNYFLCTVSSLETFGIDRKLTKSYATMIRSWSNFLRCFEPNTCNEILDVSLFGNHMITFNNRSLLFTSFLKSKLFKLSDVWDAEKRDFISETMLLRKLKNTSNWIAQWSKLKTCIPKHFIRALKQEHMESDKQLATTMLNTLFLKNHGKIIHANQLKSKEIVKIFNYKSKKMQLNSELKWNEKLNLCVDWKKTWSCIYNSYASRKARQFQWKFLHNIIFTEHKLNLMMVSNGLCNMCSSKRETLVHLFWECEHIKPIWEQVERLIDVAMESLKITEFSLSYSKVVIGTNQAVINTILFESKWIIWKYRNDFKFSNKKPNITKFKKQLLNNINTQLKYQHNEKIKYIIDHEDQGS